MDSGFCFLPFWIVYLGKSLHTVFKLEICAWTSFVQKQFEVCYFRMCLDARKTAWKTNFFPKIKFCLFQDSILKSLSLLFQKKGYIIIDHMNCANLLVSSKIESWSSLIQDCIGHVDYVSPIRQTNVLTYKIMIIVYGSSWCWTSPLQFNPRWVFIVRLLLLDHLVDPRTQIPNSS